MLDRLEKLIPFDLDFVRVPVIGSAGITATMFDNLLARATAVLMFLILLLKLIKIIRRWSEKE